MVSKFKEKQVKEREATKKKEEQAAGEKARLQSEIDELTQSREKVEDELEKVMKD